jgi:hypothetical protein
MSIYIRCILSICKKQNITPINTCGAWIAAVFMSDHNIHRTRNHSINSYYTETLLTTNHDTREFVIC